MSENHNIQNHFLAAFTPEDCRPCIEDVVCYLGGADYQPSPNILKRVNKALPLAEGVVAPTAAFSIFPVRKADPAGVMLSDGRHISAGTVVDWQQAEYIAASVATLGPDLEKKCRELSNSEPFSAIVLDAVGVAFLDNLGELVGRESCRQAQLRGLHCGTRISPGLGNVDLSLQSKLFDLVDHQALGMELTEAWVMKPFKSISEFRAFESRPQPPAPAHKCMQCDLETCDFRRNDSKTEHPC